MCKQLQRADLWSKLHPREAAAAIDVRVAVPDLSAGKPAQEKIALKAAQVKIAVAAARDLRVQVAVPVRTVDSFTVVWSVHVVVLALRARKALAIFVVAAPTRPHLHLRHRPRQVLARSVSAVPLSRH